ncbi:MAG: excalibur calcium-binding domain-containing protein [Deltaproteobacteria bacterium]|nr:excalibur calcium-binding domain-containing protein [Deltaproteobacteria bacterium]
MNRSRFVLRCVLFAGCLGLGVAAHGPGAEEWRGLAVAPEHRCAPYRSKDYPYPQAVELRIITQMGGRIYGPYTGRYFSSRRMTDIEHVVARSEAHDSGLCRADSATKRDFARDLLNLTLAAPAVNRCGRNGKCAHDAAGWLPPMNQCWFAGRVLEVRRKYRLTVDRREAAALDRVLSGCNSTEMVFMSRPSAPDPPPRVSRPPSRTSRPPSREALRRWDDNGNGRITCKEARRHGIAPVRRGHPAYPFMWDRDGDGIVCE